MSRILIRNPHSVALIDTALGPVTFHIQGASHTHGVAGDPVNIIAKQQDFLPIVAIASIGQYLRGGFQGHDWEFGQIVLDLLYQKIEEARGGDVNIDAVEILANNSALEQDLARSWITPELKAAVAELLPDVPGLSRSSRHPKASAFYYATERFERMERKLSLSEVIFAPASALILAEPSRSSDRAKCEQVLPVEEWRTHIFLAANLYLDAWYALATMKVR